MNMSIAWRRTPGTAAICVCNKPKCLSCRDPLTRSCAGYDSGVASGRADVEAAARKRHEAEELELSVRRSHPLLGDFQREPSASSINAVQNAGDKRMELAWVYTVIAGVLNIMVIYDAYAGPAFTAAAVGPSREEQGKRGTAVPAPGR